VENVKKPTIKSSKITQSPLSKKEAKSPEVSKPVKSKPEKPNDADTPETFPQVGTFLTNNDDALTGRTSAVHQDPIGLMSGGTKATNMPETQIC
jgi:hypothetical protein